jgi:hypothetical protein
MKGVRNLLILFAVALAGCASKPPETTVSTKQATVETPGPATTTSRHPYAKYLELSGFRLREAQAGRLEVKLVAINHSQADLGDLTLKVRLTTTKAAPEDPPVATFDVRVMGLGPSETKDVSASAETKLRLYELPDWQFLRASFDITDPQL